MNQPLKYLLLLVVFAWTHSAAAQADCRSILKKAVAAYRDGKGNLDRSLQYLLDAEICDYQNLIQKERQSLQKKIFQAIQQQKKEAERLRDELNLALIEAKDAKVRADKERDNALAAKKESEKERQRTEEAYNQLTEAFSSIAENLVKIANTQIYHLKYNDALGNLIAATNLKALEQHQAIAEALMEVAYFYNESGSHILAGKIADILINFENKTDSILTDYASDISHRTHIRKVLQQLNPSFFVTLEARYYPVMRPVDGGTFSMGCNPKTDKNCDRDEGPHYLVTLDDFKLASTETTIWQYNLFCQATGQDIIKSMPGWGFDGDNPIVKVDWYDALRYANWLGIQMGLDTAYIFDKNNKFVGIRNNIQNTFRLPSEMQWEYAARGGKSQSAYRYSGSDDVFQVGWHGGFHKERTSPIAQLLPNILGIYDMSGNVMEWCETAYTKRYNATMIETAAAIIHTDDTKIIMRGGSWFHTAVFCRNTNRDWGRPTQNYFNWGFRLCQN